MTDDETRAPLYCAGKVHVTAKVSLPRARSGRLIFVNFYANMLSHGHHDISASDSPFHILPLRPSSLRPHVSTVHRSRQDVQSYVTG